MALDYLTFTKQYHAEWLDVSPTMFEVSGAIAMHSSKREERQAGHSKPFPLYCFVVGGSVTISFCRDYENRIPRLLRKIGIDLEVDAVVRAVKKVYKRAPLVASKYYFAGQGQKVDISLARQLTGDDLPLYYDFLREMHGIVGRDDQSDAYFRRITDKGYCFGIFEADKLVCLVDAPDIPYMSETIVEPGIAVLSAYRRKGYATVAVSALLKRLAKEQKVPVWSCGAANIASAKLAESLGYRQLGTVISLSQ